MSYLRSQGTQVTKYSGLQVQTTSSALPVPIVMGCNTLSGNVIWYNDFVAKPSGGKGGGKGGGNSSVTSWDYRCALIIGLCEGPINNVGNVWQTATTPINIANLGLTLFDGTSPQTPWSYVTSYHSDQALGYPGTCLLAGSNYDLGASGSLGSTIFEVQGFHYGTGVNGVDADPATVIYDLLTNSQFGMGFPASSISSATLFSNSGDSSYQTYCWASFIAISPALDSQETGISILTRIMQITNSTVIWSDGLLKFIPYGDSTVTNAGKTWTPSIPVVYSLTDEDFVYTSGADPIEVVRTSTTDAKNWVSLEIKARSDSYNTGPVTAFDQGAINQFGLRIGSSVTAHEICDLTCARQSIQLILQRGLYIRNTYKFTLSEEFCLLEPMDIVQLTDPLIGLNATSVRITDIEEQDNGDFTITAEEFPSGTATAVSYPTQTKSNGSPNSNVTPPSVNTPLIFEPTPALTGNTSQVWIGASGAGSSVNWGGCAVLVSLDNVSYENIGTISQSARQGILTATLPYYSGSAPDNTNTLSVNLTSSGGVLATTTTASAAGGYNLCYVGGEFLSFTTATLTSSYQYNLTSLYRSLDGTGSGPDASGSQFCMLDSAIFKYSLPANMIGQTLYFKFQSFNIFGGQLQDPSTCSVYTFVPAGTGTVGPVTSALLVGASLNMGTISAVTETDTFGFSGGPLIASISLGTALS